MLLGNKTETGPTHVVRTNTSTRGVRRQVAASKKHCLRRLDRHFLSKASLSSPIFTANLELRPSAEFKFEVPAGT